MSDTPQNPFASMRIVYAAPGMDAVTVRRDDTYRVSEGHALTMDVYYPPDAPSGARLPAVIFVTGFSDADAQRMLGRRFKEMGSYVSWAQVVAASGMVAITYANDAPAHDVDAVLQHVRDHAEELRIDERRIALWSCSGNVPNALSVLMRSADALTCAVLFYGYLLDLDGASAVADAPSRSSKYP